MSRTQQSSSNWYALDGAVVQYHAQETTITAGNQTTTSTSWVELARVQLDCDNAGFLVQEQLAKFTVVGFMDTNGPTFEVRLYNVTDSAALVTVSFTETTPTYKEGSFVWPDGTKLLSVEVRRVGSPSRTFNLRRSSTRLLVSP